MGRRYHIYLFFFLLFHCALSSGQENEVKRGALFKKGTKERIGHALIRNQSRSYLVTSNDLGIFSILSSIGDSIEISADGFENMKFTVINLKDTIIYLQPSGVLKEVQVYGKSRTADLKEVSSAAHKKGVYYNGKPPLSLLSPFNGSPLTFFYELFSKEGKRARRAQRFVSNEEAYYEVAGRFNDETIKRIVRIPEKDLEEFKSAYWPDIMQVRSWTEFDLYNYIKVSYGKFKSKNEATQSN